MSAGSRLSARFRLGEGARGARRMQHSPAFRWLVRAGFVARALTYALVGALTVSLAVGAGTDGVAADQQGALALIARSAIGEAALAVIAAALLCYSLWKFIQGIAGQGPEGGGSPKTWDRISNLAGGIVYLAFFGVALRTLLGSERNSSSQPRRAAAGILGWPGGPLLVAIAGIVLLGVSAYQIYDALSGNFTKEVKTARMREPERRTFRALGKVGITARALAFALIGYFIFVTALNYDSRDAVGLDGALARLHQQPFGPELVGLAGAGFLVFAAYSVLEGRYRRL
jgi:hypothetical protein